MAEQYDLIVIGAGPAGYPAALKGDVNQHNNRFRLSDRQPR